MGTLKIVVVAIFMVATAATVLASAAIHENKEHQKGTFDLKSMSWTQRLGLFMVAKLNPKAFEKMPQELFAEISVRPSIVSIDNFFIDARQLFTQASKLSDVANLPEYQWYTYWDVCFPNFCLDYELSWITKGTRFVGGETVRTSTNFTPTNFQNTFEVPYFNWTSPGFTFNFTDNLQQEMYLFQNTYISFEDLMIIFQGDYKFVPDIGIQLENVAIYFNAGKVSWLTRDLTRWDFNENLLERYDSEEYFSDEIMMDHWTWAKEYYSPILEISLNCFLSNGRSDPEDCEEGKYWGAYYEFANLELIQSIGLGALLSS